MASGTSNPERDPTFKGKTSSRGPFEIPSDVLPPYSLEAEQATLGAVLKDFNVLNYVIDSIPKSEFFFSTNHQAIYGACLHFFLRSEPFDITIVAERLSQTNELERVGGRHYLVELVEGIATTANVGSYAKIVKDKYSLRTLMFACNYLIRECYSQELPVDDVLEEAEKRIFAISDMRMTIEFSSLESLLPHTFKQMEKFQETEGGIAGLKVGYDSIDEMTGGLHPGEFIVIAGRPSMGKSALAMNIAENVAVTTKKAVGVFSLEMSKEALALRVLCGKARISQHLLRTGKMRDSDWQRLAQAAGPLSDSPIFIDDSGTMTPLEMRAKARRLKSKHDISLLIIDYMQMMHGTGRPENRQQEMSVISRSMKALAKELAIPVIACSQLSRQVEQRGTDRRPQLSDLRESGAIEQDADVVMFVYRQEYYTHHDDPKFPEVEGKAEIIIAKQRNGPIGTCHLTF
ncbi:MAG: replicative DNA helicase, partial [candidate division Zixibacteria bacterium]|nr:replicative DNA helicase [candidate division Zixibacteria bacterium]